MKSVILDGVYNNMLLDQGNHTACGAVVDEYGVQME
jgi:hypothetical protein